MNSIFVHNIRPSTLMSHVTHIAHICVLCHHKVGNNTWTVAS